MCSDRHGGISMRRGPVALLALAVLAASPHAYAQENARLAFVTQYVRHIAEMERIRDTALAVYKENPKDFPSSCIQSAESFNNELAAQINMMAGDEYDFKVFDHDVRKGLIEAYELKIRMYQKLSDYCGQIVGPVDPKVDLHKTITEIPKLNADLDTVDHSIFEGTPVMFSVLLNEKPDSQNHVSHLLITRAERDQLTSTIQNYFGKKMAQKDQNWLVSSISVLNTYLTKKGFKCADEPWQ
jgi:hypothetical protein